MNDVCMFTPKSTPNQIRSTPSFSATGPISGTTMKDSSKKSRKNARKKISRFTTIRKPIWPPGSEVRRCSTQRWPSTPWNTSEKKVEPIRMKTTKHESLVVVVRACLSSENVRRPRTSAITIAPIAPIAPPSVGVAMPRKMVPSTRKISSSGGISTKVTRSAMRDSRFSPRALFTRAATKAKITQAALAVVLADRARLQRQRRGPRRREDRHQDHVGGVHAREDETGDEGALV